MSRPFVILKLATSLDGRIATASGESRWITSAAARAEVQRMRAEADAVMIGAGTARADDPELLARTDPAPRRQPLRVVLDTELGLQAKGRLFASLEAGPVLVVGGEGAAEDSRVRLEAAGARVKLARRGAGGVDIASALAVLEGEGVTRVLVEGGGMLAASLIQASAVDRIEWFRAPLALGAEGRAGIGALALARLGDAPAFKRVAVRELGPDLWESYERA